MTPADGIEGSAPPQDIAADPGRWPGGPVEFDRVVPPSGNMWVTNRQFWMGTHRAGMTARIWADCDLIHVLVSGIRIKTVRSHLSVADLARLIAQGAVPAGPSPLPPAEDHIAPARSAFRGSKFFGGPVKYVLSGSGHIAGVVNPPSKAKYQ